jgi:hypothetical protein
MYLHFSRCVILRLHIGSHMLAATTHYLLTHTVVVVVL